MNELSVIIAFRNEGIEIENTIQEIKRTAGNMADIILVNDASEDDYDYKGIAEKYNTTYIENIKRQGCAASREIGIEVVKTPYLFIIDGHMRFYDNNWLHKIVGALKTNSRSIYCCRCKAWDYETKIEMNSIPTYGAYFELFIPDKYDIMEVKWITQDIFEDADIVEIPCVLGACYAASKDYWNYLKGLGGLKFYSCDEAYISIKSWMEGGGCRLLKNVVIGHLFRSKAPYNVCEDEFAYNKYFIAETVFPKDIKEFIHNKMKVRIGFVNFSRIKRKQKKDLLDYYTNYYNSILTLGYENFQKINDHIIERIKIS